MVAVMVIMVMEEKEKRHEMKDETTTIIHILCIIIKTTDCRSKKMSRKLSNERIRAAELSVSLFCRGREGGGGGG